MLDSGCAMHLSFVAIRNMSMRLKTTSGVMLNFFLVCKSRTRMQEIPSFSIICRTSDIVEFKRISGTFVREATVFAIADLRMVS